MKRVKDWWSGETDEQRTNRKAEETAGVSDREIRRAALEKANREIQEDPTQAQVYRELGFISDGLNYPMYPSELYPNTGYPTTVYPEDSTLEFDFQQRVQASTAKLNEMLQRTNLTEGQRAEATRLLRLANAIPEVRKKQRSNQQELIQIGLVAGTPGNYDQETIRKSVERLRSMLNEKNLTEDQRLGALDFLSRLEVYKKSWVGKLVNPKKAASQGS